MNLREQLFKQKIEILKSMTDPETNKIQSNLLNKVSCPICGKDQSKRVYQKDGFDFVQCDICTDFVYVNPQLKSNICESFYISSDIMSTLIELQQEEKAIEAKIKYRPILDRLEKYKANERQLLDIGCSIGNFMELACEYGWKAEGIEINKKAIELCRQKGLKVYNTKLDEFRLNSSYDLITMFALIEHLVDPNSMLQSIHHILKERGYLLLFFPDWNFDWHHPQVNGRAHLWYFTNTTIKMLLKKNNYQICETWVIDWLKGPKRIVIAKKVYS